MLKLFLFSLLSVVLYSDSIFIKEGKQMYKSMSNTIKASTNIVRSNMNITPTVSSTLPKEEIYTQVPKAREAFLKKQFIPKEKILEVQKVKKEEINVDVESLEFFDSLNSYTKKPVNIE